MTIDIMGSAWTITECSEKDDPNLNNADGYCDWTTRRIVIEREISGSLNDMEEYIRKVTRHEIVHAFLLECGLHEATSATDSWANNEEMVDWFARVGPRIHAAWRAAGAV